MSTLTRIIFLLFFLICLIVPSSAWLAGYTYRQGHYINGSDSGAQSNYQVMLNVSNTVGSSSSNLMYLNAHSVAFPDDLRFTDTSDTAWDYWVESNNTTYATIWVEVPSIPAGSTSQVEMYCYYGKAGGTSASNGPLTFPLLFDHFDGAGINASLWTTTGDVSVSSSNITVIGGGTAGQLISISFFNTNTAVRTFCSQTFNHDVATGETNIGYYNSSFSQLFFTGGYPTNFVLNTYTWDGASEQGANIGSGFTGNHIKEIIRINSTSHVWKIDNGGVTSPASPYSTTSMGVAFRSLTTNDRIITSDWVFVRNYTDPEPTHSTYISECTPPVAAFTANTTSGYPPFAVQFTDTSTGTPTTWDWYFPNGGDAHATPATWTFDYNIGNTATSYDIELNVSNACGSDWENKTNYITAYPLEAHFSANTTSGTSPLCVQFTDSTTNGTPINWSWDFGDGNTSFDHNPTHCYYGTGLYTVRLNASNLYSWDWLNETNYINVTTVTPTPTPTPTPTATTVGNATIYPSTYLSEETAVPFELFILLIILGVVFLGLGIALASPMHIVVVSLMGMMFLAAAAFVAPVVGFFNYEAFSITNTTTGNVSMTFIPSVSLVAQPWVSWLLWGMFLVGLINMGVRGVGGWWMEAGQKKDEWER